MKKKMKQIGICMVIVALIWSVELIRDKEVLRRELIRLHVVAASDSAQDQKLKLQVRDAVIRSLQSELSNLKDVNQAKAYLQQNLPKIEAVAGQTLRILGCSDSVRVQLCEEEFSKRDYDTFSLPAGVYQSLRIIIGDGEGKNWWCVVFPSLCLGAAAEDFEETASCAGLPKELTAALEGKEGYELRFFLLEALGRVENLFHKG